MLIWVILSVTHEMIMSLKLIYWSGRGPLLNNILLVFFYFAENEKRVFKQSPLFIMELKKVWL